MRCRTTPALPPGVVPTEGKAREGDPHGPPVHAGVENVSPAVVQLFAQPVGRVGDVLRRPRFSLGGEIGVAVKPVVRHGAPAHLDPFVGGDLAPAHRFLQAVHRASGGRVVAEQKAAQRQVGRGRRQLVEYAPGAGRLRALPQHVQRQAPRIPGLRAKEQARVSGVDLGKGRVQGILEDSQRDRGDKGEEARAYVHLDSPSFKPAGGPAG